MSRVSAELFRPTSSYLVSPAALTPSLGRATVRGSRASLAPKPLEAQLDSEKKGPGLMILGAKLVWAASLLGWTEWRLDTQQIRSCCSYQPQELLPGLSWLPLVSAAPEMHLSWQVHLPPQRQCESDGQNSLVPQSWSSQSISSSSVTGVCLPCSSLLLLLLLSCFSCVRLCATPEMAAYQAPPSLGFSRQEHWSGLPFPSPMHKSEKSK